MFIYFIYYDQGSWEQKIKHRIKRLQRSFARRSIAYQKVDDPGSTPASSKKSLRKTEEMWSSVPEIPEEEPWEKRLSSSRKFAAAADQTNLLSKTS